MKLSTERRGREGTSNLLYHSVSLAALSFFSSSILFFSALAGASILDFSPAYQR